MSRIRARVSLLLLISLYNPRFSPEWCVLKRDDQMAIPEALFRQGGKRETGPQPRLRPYRTPGKGHRARGELTRPRRASTSSPRARCEARARAFRVFPVAIFGKSVHLPVLKTASYTISRRKVILERRKVLIITGTGIFAYPVEIQNTYVRSGR